MSKTTRKAIPPSVISRLEQGSAPYPLIASLPPASRRPKHAAPMTQLQVLAASVNGDNTSLSFLLPYADAELPRFFAGTGAVEGFTEESIRASALRILFDSHPDAEFRDEATFASSAFALGYIAAARLFGGVR